MSASRPTKRWCGRRIRNTGLSNRTFDFKYSIIRVWPNENVIHCSELHMSAVKYLLRYIQGTLDYSFTYSPSSDNTPTVCSQTTMTSITPLSMDILMHLAHQIQMIVALPLTTSSFSMTYPSSGALENKFMRSHFPGWMVNTLLLQRPLKKPCSWAIFLRCLPFAKYYIQCLSSWTQKRPSNTSKTMSITRTEKHIDTRHHYIRHVFNSGNVDIRPVPWREIMEITEIRQIRQLYKASSSHIAQVLKSASSLHTLVCPLRTSRTTFPLHPKQLIFSPNLSASSNIRKLSNFFDSILSSKTPLFSLQWLHALYQASILLSFLFTIVDNLSPIRLHVHVQQPQSNFFLHVPHFSHITWQRPTLRYRHFWISCTVPGKQYVIFYFSFIVDLTVQNQKKRHIHVGRKLYRL